MGQLQRPALCQSQVSHRLKQVPLLVPQGVYAFTCGFFFRGALAFLGHPEEDLVNIQLPEAALQGSLKGLAPSLLQ